MLRAAASSTPQTSSPTALVPAMLANNVVQGFGLGRPVQPHVSCSTLGSGTSGLGASRLDQVRALVSAAVVVFEAPLRGPRA
eukprot:2211173-Heterocapsa_arctica.AAC.1